MLSRVLEPEVMDSAKEAEDYDTMDHTEVNRLFVSDLLQLRPTFFSALDVGTGTAQIPVELCRRHRQAHVIAIDLAQHMLRRGQENLKRAGLTDLVQLHLCDAKRMPFTDGSFDVAMSNSIVHHIPEPYGVLVGMTRVVKSGGLLFVRDLLRPPSEEALQGFVERYAGDASANQRQMFADSLHAAFTLDEIQEMVQRLGFPASTVTQTSDRHWTWAAAKE